MKLKIVMLTQDSAYAERFLNAALLYYKEKMELAVFSDCGMALEKVLQGRFDILWSDPDYELDYEKLPRYCSLVYVSDHKDFARMDGYPAIMKYQSLENIYKKLLAVYADRIARDRIGIQAGQLQAKILTFLGGAGGVGTSTAAAACARYIARERGESVLYLNIEESGSADLYFQADGVQDFGKVLYALEINNSGSRVKMESALKKDESGVYFYSPPAIALDMLDLKKERMEDLIQKLGEMNLFQWIVTDMDFHFSERVYNQIERSVKTVLVSDGSSGANCKLHRKLEALEVIAQERMNFPIDRIFLLYNRFSSQYGRRLEHTAFKMVGGINRINADSSQGLQEAMVQSRGGVFASLLDQ